MGLFDSVLGKRRSTELSLGPVESFLAITLLAIAADGYISDDETRVLNSTLWRQKMFRSYSSDTIASSIDRLLGIIRRQGSEVLLNAAIAGIPHDLHDTVFAVTTDIILADGEVTAEEEDLLNELHQALDLPDDLAQTIVAVMVIKNKG
ncbi:tellurite resistance TerB family protein [Baaleninema sp.]|uniref:tellurite resistance TerB family protein n=1 Tax=Baaleninema sp. TaxID=3101197 RepID=UPI003D060FBB